MAATSHGGETQYHQRTEGIDIGMIPGLQGLDWRRAGAYQKASCPRHVDKTPSLVLYPDKHFHCFSCGWHGWAEEGQTNDPAPILKEKKEKIYPTIDWTPYKLACNDKMQRYIAEWRGYPISLVRQLVKENMIGGHDGDVCLPIHQNGRIVRAHIRGTRWHCFPEQGAKISALVYGTKKPNETHIFESQWDMFAVASQFTLYTRQLVATRGATATARLDGMSFPKNVYLWPQNDDAGMRWLETVKLYVPNRRVYIVNSPAEDPNEFLKQGGDLKHLYEQAQTA